VASGRANNTASLAPMSGEFAAWEPLLLGFRTRNGGISRCNRYKKRNTVVRCISVSGQMMGLLP
jgi:hypothetical protein